MGEWPEDTRAALCQEFAPRDPFAEFARGEITINTLRILVRHVYAWTQDQEIAAAVYDQTLWARWDYVRSNIPDGEPAPAMPPGMPRPWEREDREREAAENAAAVDESRAWFKANVESQLSA